MKLPFRSSRSHSTQSIKKCARGHIDTLHIWLAWRPLATRDNLQLADRALDAVPMAVGCNACAARLSLLPGASMFGLDIQEQVACAVFHDERRFVFPLADVSLTAVLHRLYHGHDHGIIVVI